ncbi:hypothetical protein K435DRAFT_865972 [Dendrothele bispora CBS 962.96]|uniref:Uncharacterized protein n=1 Tax=Dendrothele bispora (strain CBS 962.96) TaxID=1314807 RepID=A0A4S8LIP6_DENBC|nr:hypothetical protein K435DRAFT_865972 [Dendrothele bispora CBS 962.96]
MGWLKQLRHSLRHGAQSLLGVLDSDDDNEQKLDTRSVQSSSYPGVVNNLTPVPTNSDTMEEENQVTEQLINASNSNSSEKHAPVFKEGI